MKSRKWSIMFLTGILLVMSLLFLGRNSSVLAEDSQGLPEVRVDLERGFSVQFYPEGTVVGLFDGREVMSNEFIVLTKGKYFNVGWENATGVTDVKQLSKNSWEVTGRIETNQGVGLVEIHQIIEDIGKAVRISLNAIILNDLEPGSAWTELFYGFSFALDPYAIGDIAIRVLTPEEKWVELSIPADGCFLPEKLGQFWGRHSEIRIAEGTPYALGLKAPIGSNDYTQGLVADLRYWKGAPGAPPAIRVAWELYVKAAKIPKGTQFSLSGIEIFLP